MEPEEQIYVNLEELGVPEKTETQPDSEEAAWSCSVLKAAVGLMLLVLVAAVAAVAALYSRDVRRLSNDLANHTAERVQLLVRYQNLSHQRDQLQTRLTRVLKDVGSCPGGWKRFGCSCYFFSPNMMSWESSRLHCSDQGARLVDVSSPEEMEFLNKLGDHLKFWIGLSQESGKSNWVWTDGRFPTDTFWLYREPSRMRYLGRRCAAFNSFAAGSLSSWTMESCYQLLQWVCKKEMVPSDLTSL